MKSRLAVMLAAIIALIALPAAAASAASPPTDSIQQGPLTSDVGILDWNGYCSLTAYRTSAWGWCDGTGPQRYQILARCNGVLYGSASTPWFGDRRGAWVYCPSGTVVTAVGWRRA